MKKSTLNHMTMYQNVLAVMNSHQPVWNGIQGVVTTVAELNDLLNSLAGKLQLQSSLTQGIRLEKQAFLDEFIEEMSLLKKGLFLYALEAGNLSLRERNKESRSKLISLSVDRLEILSHNLEADLEQFGSQLTAFGIDAALIQSFNAKAALIESRKNSVRQAIIERSLETRNIKELEKTINRLLLDKLDRFISFFKASNSSFFNTYKSARRIIEKHGNTGPKINERDDGQQV